MDASLQLTRSDPRYPAALSACLGPRAPDPVWLRGDPDILNRKSMALFCSVRCPGHLIVRTYDLAQKWRAAGIAVIGGFHSPMERQCLAILLKSPHPVIVCPARGLPRRVAPEFRRPLEEGRLVLISPFADAICRADEASARERNRFVAALADCTFAAYAAPGSHTESFCREIVAWKKPLYTFADAANENLLALGARPIDPDDLPVS